MKKGMTLTELLIVVSIIAFLSILVTGFLRTQVFKGNDAKRKTDLNRISIALEEYEKDNDCYPLPDLVVCNPGIGLRSYLDKIPCDPINNSSYLYEYEDSTCPKWYRIYTNLENENDNDYLADIGPNSSFSYYVDSPNAPAIIVPESTPSPTQGNEIPSVDYYGCFSGVPTQINWDPTRPGPECDPNYQNPNCYGQCVNPLNECISWNQ
jgi:prepilin-type N-terminal cleavage/methylation domain-containing protein